MKLSVGTLFQSDDSIFLLESHFEYHNNSINYMKKIIPAILLLLAGLCGACTSAPKDESSYRIHDEISLCRFLFEIQEEGVLLMPEDKTMNPVLLPLLDVNEYDFTIGGAYFRGLDFDWKENPDDFFIDIIVTPDIESMNQLCKNLEKKLNLISHRVNGRFMIFGGTPSNEFLRAFEQLSSDEKGDLYAPPLIYSCEEKIYSGFPNITAITWVVNQSPSSDDVPDSNRMACGVGR